MQITDVHDVLGAEVHQLDLRDPLSSEDSARLRAVFTRRHLLLFRGQHLSGDQQADFAALLGPIAAEKSGRYGYVSNVMPEGLVPEGRLLFHSDFAFTDEPVLALSLHALEVPSDGAPTVFASSVHALDALPAAQRDAIAGHRIVNVYDFKRPTDCRMREQDLAPGSPRVERPFVGEHRRTGVPVINANEMHTDRVVGLPPDESEALLADVYSVLYGTANVYEHRWAVGDLIVWDNIALHHGRPAFPEGEARTMQRVCINDKTAHELVPNLDELLA